MFQKVAGISGYSLFIFLYNFCIADMEEKGVQQPVVSMDGGGLIKPTIKQFVTYAKSLYARSHVEPDLALVWLRKTTYTN